MNLNQACINILDQLADLVSHIHEHDYYKPIETLSNSTIGQHIRHTLEFFICLEQGCEKGLINYDKRLHDKLIESDKFLASAAIANIKKFVNTYQGNADLNLEAGYDMEKEVFITIRTNYARELVYNIEHAVHHMALIKIGIQSIASYITLPQDFGIAASTIRYRESVVSAH